MLSACLLTKNAVYLLNYVGLCRWIHPASGHRCVLCLVYFYFVGEGIPEKQAQFQKILQDSEKVKVNSPVHLACKVGDLDILKILVPKEDTIESQLLLQEKSIVTYNANCSKCLHHSSVSGDKETCSIYDGKCNGITPSVIVLGCTDVNKNEKVYSSPRQDSNLVDNIKLNITLSARSATCIGDTNASSGCASTDRAIKDSQNETNFDVINQQSHGVTLCESKSGNSQDVAISRSPGSNCSCLISEENVPHDEKTPFEVCIEEKQLQCASYLARILYDLKRPTAFVKRNRQPPLKRNWQPFMVQEINAVQRDHVNYRRFYFGDNSVKGNNSKVPLQEKSLLHVACFLGNAAYLDLLLRNGFRSVINERDEMSIPPLFAAISSSVECVKLLLMYGAEVNATVACQNALHKLYDESTEETSFMTDCTEALIWAGINVNAQDSNNNTPLDYLASDFSKESLQMTQHGRFMTLAERNQHARKCMELLLEAGARTQVPTSSGNHIDHTIGHTLLLNSSWPVSSFFAKNPKLVYLILELFFKHGQDPNIVPVNNESSLLSQLIAVIGNCLSTFEDELQTKFMHLFLISGADLNHRIPPPRMSRDSGPIRIWNVYPLIMALQEKLPVAVLELMANFMSLSSLSDCVVTMSEGQTWLRFEMMRGNGTAPGTQATNPYAHYKTQWENLAPRLQMTPRSLRHCTKLVILDSLHRKGNQVAYLPIPKAMQLYLCNDKC